MANTSKRDFEHERKQIEDAPMREFRFFVIGAAFFLVVGLSLIGTVFFLGFAFIFAALCFWGSAVFWFVVVKRTNRRSISR